MDSRVDKIAFWVTKVLHHSLHRKPEIAYPIALLLAGSAIITTWILPPAQRSTSALLLVAVAGLVALIFGRLGPAFLSVVLSGTCIDYLFLGPSRELSELYPVRMGLLLSLVLLSWLIHQAYAERHASVVERDHFLGTVAHELRNPISSMLLRLSLMGRANPGDKNIDALDRQMRRLLDLMNSLLDVSRFQEGKLKLHNETFNLGHLVQEILDTAFTDAEVNMNTTPVKLDIKQEVVGSWDRIRLEQAITNLISNACKYGEGFDVVITVDKTDGKAILTVEDRGLGMSPEVVKILFQRYSRGTTKYKGFGLGLWVTKQVVDAHGGTIEVNSEPSKGSTFRVILPKRSRFTHVNGI